MNWLIVWRFREYTESTSSRGTLKNSGRTKTRRRASAFDIIGCPVTGSITPLIEQWSCSVVNIVTIIRLRDLRSGILQKDRIVENEIIHKLYRIIAVQEMKNNRKKGKIE